MHVGARMQGLHPTLPLTAYSLLVYPYLSGPLLTQIKDIIKNNNYLTELNNLLPIK
jgi:hypothetical protein